MSEATGSSRYSIRGGDEGKARLDLLATALRPTTMAALERVGVPTGARCVDLGCGGGHVTCEVARLVGFTGSVVGVDLDARILELARQDAVAGELANVEFRVGDVSQFEDRLLDLVFARLLLCHVSAPMDIVRRAVAALRPGGVLLVEEPEFSACFSWPRHEGYDRCMALQAQVIRAKGGDPDLGPRLPSMLMGAGLRDVELCVFQPAFRTGPCKDIPQLSLERMAEAITGEALASGEEIQALIEDVGALAADPQSVLSYPRFFQVWGRL